MTTSPAGTTTNNKVGRKRRSSNGQEQPTAAPTGAAAAATNNNNNGDGNSGKSSSASSIPMMNLKPFLSGWTKLEAVPRWVLKSTWEFVVPAAYHYHSHNHHHSETVQRVLQEDSSEHDDSDNARVINWDLLKQQYAKEIKADPQVQSLSKQIRTLKQQLSQQRSAREKLERKHLATREREQRQLAQHRLKLKQALEATMSSSSGGSSSSSSSSSSSNNKKTNRQNYYTKALWRAHNGKHKRSGGGGSSPLGSGSSRGSSHGNGGSGTTTTSSAIYNKLSQAAVAAATPMTSLASAAATAAATAATASTNGMSSINNNSNLTPDEKEAWALETSVLRTMHQTFVYQNQCDVAQKYYHQVISPLKQWRAALDTQQAEVAMYRMVLDGTHRALSTLYPEIVLGQEDLLARCRQRRQQPPRNHRTGMIMTMAGLRNNNYSSCSSSINSSIPRTIAGTATAVSSSSTTAKPKTAFGAAATAASFLRKNNNRIAIAASRRSFRSMRSDGISDLGESIVESFTEEADERNSVYSSAGSAGSVGGGQKKKNHLFLPPGRGGPVFTSVEALQQQTLQHLAGVESY